MRPVFAIIGLLTFILTFAISARCAHTDSTDPPCEAPDAWFAASGTPAVRDDFKVPSDDECNFYKWGWQSFLWLTQSDDGIGTPRFVLFNTPNDLFPTSDSASPQLIAAPRSTENGKRILALSVRTSPATSRTVTTIATDQAGSHGVLVDQHNRVVYFGQHYNSQFEKFVKLDLKLKTPSDIKNVNPTAQFPPGCLELKSSWRVLTDQEKSPSQIDAVRKRFFVTDAKVPTLVQISDSMGKISIHADVTQPRSETVALVGLHVVGTIVDHPEFIWASFEHVDNAPVLAAQNLPSDTPISKDTRFTFYRAGKQIIECNVNPVKSTTAPLTLTDPSKQTLNPITDVFRQFNSGDDLVSVDDQVDSLNKSVLSKLSGNLSVWKNYQLIGAVWIADPKNNFAEGMVFGDSLLAGEKRLSNTTMESFTQTTNANCFSCHHTASETENGRTIPDLRIKVSHILRNAFIFGQ